MIILLPFIILLFVGILGAFGFISTASTLSSWLFLILILIISYRFVSPFINSLKKFTKKGNLFEYILSHQKSIFIFISLVSLFIASLSKVYYLGGDDTRLFFLYPYEYYTRFASAIVGDNTLSNIGNFLPTTCLSLFLFLFIALKTFFFGINLQSFLYVLNILLGILFFYKLLDFLISEEFVYRKYIYFVSSCLYVFSLFNFYTLYNSRLTAVFLISVLPLSLYLFLKACKEKKLHLIALLAIILTVTTVTSIASLWFVAAILVLLPLLIYLLRFEIKRAFLYVIFLIMCIILLNFNWLVFLGHTTLIKKTGGEASNSIVSQNFLNDNAEGVRSTVRGNSFFYPLLNSYHRTIQENNNWPYLPIYRSWYQLFLPLNLFFILTIFVAGFLGRKNKKVYPLYVVSSLSLFIALYFFTIVAGETTYRNLGTESFIWLINHIPGFIIFRNMYDKFGLAMSISFAILFAVSLRLLFTAIQNDTFKKLFLIAGTALCFIIAKPFIFGEFDRLPIWTTSNLYQGTTAFNDDYMNLVNFIKNQEYHGRYAFIPLSGGNVLPIQDKYKSDHYYVGVSPLLILSGKNDYSGTLSFGQYDKDLYYAILDQDYEKAGRIFQNMNVSYVVVNKDVPAQLQSSYMYDWKFFDAQKEDFLHIVAGEKIKDFGNRYSLYAINDTYRNEKIEVKDAIDSSLFSQIRYSKTASYAYHVSLTNVSDLTKLSFFEERDPGWIITSNDGKVLPLKRVETSDPYHNVWMIDKNIVSQLPEYHQNEDGTMDIEFNLYFQPYDYYYPSLSVTLFSFAGLLIYILWSEKDYLVSKIKRA